MKIQIQNGFTLYELLITVLVVGVVLTFGVPNFSEYTNNSRMTSTANDMHAAFQMARGEAARTKNNITICASANSMTAAADCGGTWDQGFIVFVDTDANRARNAATEPLLRAHPPIAEGVTLHVANNATYFMYASTGLGRLEAGGTPAVSQVVMCDSRGNVTAAGGNSAARLFVATPLGRATILRDKNLIGGAITTMGVTCP